MPENTNEAAAPRQNASQPRVINKSGTLKMDDKTAAHRTQRDIGGRPMERRGGRRGRGRDNRDAAPKEFDEVTINIDRVSRTVAGGRRMRFKALVVIGNHNNKVGVGVAKGNDVTSAVQKATAKAKKSLIEFNMDGETICHEVETKTTGAHVLMKPAAPGTGIIAGGVVRSIIGLTGVKNLISKSLGSTNKVNIAYAVIEGLRAQVPRAEWETTKRKPAEVKAGENLSAKSKETTKKSTTAKTSKTTTRPAAKKASTKPAVKKVKTATTSTKKSAAKKEAK